MSRTKKDRPYRIVLRDRSAYPDTPRHEYHDHARFGEPHYYEPMVYNRAEQKWERSGERILQGHFSEKCTIGLEQHELPKGTLMTCWPYAWFSRGRPDRWERASNRERKRTIRSRSRVELRGAARLADNGEDVGEEMLALPRRELYS